MTVEKEGLKAGMAHLASEKAIERYLVQRVEAMGGMCVKFSSHILPGLPDRLCLMPGGRTVWVELKSKGERPRPLQRVMFCRMGSIGHHVHVCDSRESVDKVMKEVEL